MREGGIVVAAGDGEGAGGGGWRGRCGEGEEGEGDGGGGHDAMIDLYITFEDHLYGISSRADIQT